MLTLTQAGQIANQYMPTHPMTGQEDGDNYLPQFGHGYYSTHYNRCDDMTVFIYGGDGHITLDAEYRDSLYGHGGWANHRTPCATEEELHAALKLLVDDINTTLRQ